jgi:hypothetical protein
MSLIEYVPLILAFFATIAGIFSNPRGSRIGVWSAVLVGMIALGVLVASTMSMRDALNREGALQASLARIQALSEERREQLIDARASLSRLERELSEANSQIRGLNSRNVELMERLRDAQDDLTSMAAPRLQVRYPRFFRENCEHCEGTLALVNTGGTISSVNDLDVIAIGWMGLDNPETREGCLFRSTPHFGGDPEVFQRHFDLRFGLRYSHQGENDVASGETAATVDVGVLLQRLNALLLEVSDEHLKNQQGLPDHRSTAPSLRACMRTSAQISIRIVYSSANGAQSTRTYTYSLNRDNSVWTLVALSGDIPMMRFGQLREEDTHDGIAAQLNNLNIRSREQTFRILVDFLSDRRIDN